MPTKKIGDTHKIVCQDFGAQILSIEPSNLLYLSDPLAEGGKCQRGGQPVLFPQFADRGSFRKHGFARDLAWSLENSVVVGDLAKVCYVLHIVSADYPEWPHAAVLTLEVELEPGVLRQRFEVLNVGSQAFSWTGGLHPYFQVEDVAQAVLYGLQNTSFIDRYEPDVVSYGGQELRWDHNPCEKLFSSAPKLNLVDPGRSLSLETTGFDQWMVWNPGEVGARCIDDLPDEDWNKFVCIEPVCVNKPVLLKPQDRFVGTFDVCW